MAGENDSATQTAAADATGTPASPPASPPNADAVAVSRPEYIPEALWDAEKNAPKADFAKDYEELTSLRSERDSRAKDVPENGAYKFELPEDFKLPEGVTYKAPDANDPEIKAFFDLAAARKWPQSLVRELLGFEAQRRLAAFQNVQQAEATRAQEMKTLGENAGPRVDEARRWLNANLPEKQAAMLGFALGSKDGVEAVESIIAATKGVKMAGKPGNAQVNQNAEIADMVGKVPAMKLFDAASLARN